jgi:hypothetical protein
MEYVHKWTTQIKEKLDHVKDTIDSTSKKENDDVEEMKKHIEHVYNEKMRENYTNIEKLNTVYDNKTGNESETNTQKPEFSHLHVQEADGNKYKRRGNKDPTGANISVIETFVTTEEEDKKKLEKLKAKEDAYAKAYLEEKEKNKYGETSDQKVEITKTNHKLAKQAREIQEEKIDPSAKFFNSLDPPIKYNKDNPPKDILELIYLSVVVLFNLPSVAIKYISMLLNMILSKSGTNEPGNSEIIRKSLTEASYVLVTFWLTYIILDFGFNPSNVQSKGPWTTFKWIPISFIKELCEILYYPSDLFIRIITKNVMPSFKYLGIEEYKPIQFVWVFCVSLFFVYNYLSKFRSKFFQCFIRKNSKGKMEMPKAASEIHLLITMAYLSKFLGISITNAVMWYLFSIGRLIKFICMIIFAHIFAPTAQFMASFWIFWFVLGPHFIMNGGFGKINDIYEQVSGAPEKSCENSGNSFINRMNVFFGTYLLHKVESGDNIKISCFTFFIWFLFFIYRLGKMDQITDRNIRLWTGISNGVGMAICVACIIMRHFWSYFFGDNYGKTDDNIDMSINISK